VAIVEDDHDCAMACVDELAAAGWTCVYFATAKAALIAAQQPDFPEVVLMDLTLPGEDSFGAIAALKARRQVLEVVALTGRAQDDFVFGALKAGASGYVLKNDALGRLAEVLEQLASGATPMSASIARRVIASFREVPPDEQRAEASAQPPVSVDAAGNPELEQARPTDRELAVLQMLSRGLSYAECGGALGMSLDTVRSHVRNSYRKLHAASKAEAVAIAMRSGWLT
jgi:DNA-binding NarL/FixJ family response regulator